MVRKMKGREEELEIVSKWGTEREDYKTEK
jgi:hypothetical protein